MQGYYFNSFHRNYHHHDIMIQTKHRTHHFLLDRRSALVLETDGVVKEGRYYATILGISADCTLVKQREGA